MSRGWLLGLLFLAGCSKSDWRTADRSSAGISPLPSIERRAVVEVYAARAVSWRGWFAVHTWITIKEKDAASYEILQVLGWRLWQGLSPVMIEPSAPDRRWFGAKPSLLYEIRGDQAQALIPKIRQAAAAYPYPREYRVWPGPNSNTFTSFILRAVPEMGLDLPPNAIGRDYLVNGRLWDRSESGTGIQISLLGLLGATVGRRDGIEVQLLGLCFGVDFARPALKLPLIGRVGS